MRWSRSWSCKKYWRATALLICSVVIISSLVIGGSLPHVNHCDQIEKFFSNVVECQAMKTSHIDQRLAAGMVARQAETLSRIEEMLRSFAWPVTELQRSLLEVVTGPVMSPGARQLALQSLVDLAVLTLRNHIYAHLESHVKWSHQSAVDVLINAIPLGYLVAQVPPEARAAFEQIHHSRSTMNLNFRGGIMWLSEEAAEPGLGGYQFALPIEPIEPLKLTKEEMEELVKATVFPSPSREDITAALRTSDWEARLDSLSRKITDKQALLNQTIDAYAVGENIQQIKKRLEPLVGGIKSSAQRIARTEAMRVAEHMQRQTWDALGDMMDGAQIIAVLDENTRPEHATRNGTIYYRYPRGGQKGMDAMPDLPDEPNCRCMTVPVLVPPRELQDDPAVREAFKHVDNAGSGDAKTHNQWFASATEKQRKQVVGVKRYAEVEQLTGRTPEWSDFIKPDGSLMTLAELKAESVLDRTARKLLIDQQIAKRREAIRNIEKRGFEWPRAKRPQSLTGTKFRGPVEIIGDTPELRQALKDAYPLATPRKLAELAGAPVGSQCTIDVQQLNDGRTQATIDYTYQQNGVTIRASRAAIFERNKRPVLINRSIRIEPTGSGLGADVFYRQVETAKAMGFRKIVCIAARSETENGYYTWPRLGFNAPIPDELADEARRLFPNARTLAGLLRTEAGRKWWQANGRTTKMAFDLNDSSKSRQRLQRYIRGRSKNE